MLKRLVYVLAAGAAFMAAGYAQQPSTVKLPVTKTLANDGKQMFVSYCAPCHGVDGKGAGPVTSQLVEKPINLTILQRNNGGKFPSAHVIAVIEFGQEMPAAHGTQDMPIWGPILGTMDHQGISADLQTLRITNLEAYVKSIQLK